MPHPAAPAQKPAPLKLPASGVLPLIWNSLLVALGYTLGALAGQGVTMGLQMPEAPQAAAVGMGKTLLGLVLSGFVISLVFGPIAARLRLKLAQRMGLLFAVLLMTGSLINVLESAFFTTLGSAVLTSGVVSAIVSYVFLAYFLARLFPPPAEDVNLSDALGRLGDRRSGLFWRIPLAGALFLPIFALFGSMVYPVLRPYYENPALGIGVTQPSPNVAMTLELARGLLFVLTMLPLVALLPGPRPALGLRLGLVLAVMVAVSPMLQAHWFPPTMRWLHGLEMAGDSLAHGMVVAWLLGSPRGYLADDPGGAESAGVRRSRKRRSR